MNMMNVYFIYREVYDKAIEDGKDLSQSIIITKDTSDIIIGGKNYSEHLILFGDENANTTNEKPSNPVTNKLYIDRKTGEGWTYDGFKWIQIIYEPKSVYDFAVEYGFTGSEQDLADKLLKDEVYYGDDEEMPEGYKLQIYCKSEDDENGYDEPVVANGMSAYEIACKYGFEGTEEEWLESIKGETGPQGETGEKGETGAQGPAGPQGEPGKTAYEYAKEAGYTGSETEFSNKLANNEIYYGDDEIMPDSCTVQIYCKENENQDNINIDTIVEKVLEALPKAEGVEY